MNRLLYIVLHVCFFVAIGFAQPPQPTNSLKRNTDAIKKSLETDSPLQLASQYETLAKQLMAIGKFDKALENFQKALAIYEKEKKPDLKAAVLRQIAQLQESQNQNDKAIENYELSNNFSNSKTVQSLNTNDVSRLQNSQNPTRQAELLDSNIEILEKSTEVNEEEIAKLYVQKVVVESQANPSNSNLQALEKTKEKVSANPVQAAKVAEVLAASYEKNKDLDKAIALQNEAVQSAVATKNQQQILAQTNQLAVLYDKNKQAQTADSIWQKAYDEAIRNQETLAAKDIVKNWSAFLNQQKRTAEALELQQQFLDTLDFLIEKDSTLIDWRLFEVTEEKIKQLEKERTLKDALLDKQTVFNQYLMGFIAVLAVFMIWIFWTLIKIRKQNKQIALQSLRREMNPHFIFNSLNSLNQFIAQNDELEANKYLTRYSTLMRDIMETSNKDFITLQDEISLLNKYLALEHLRFADVFQYEINCDNSLALDSIWVPNMIVQPHVENAIWHGLRYRTSPGFLKITIFVQGNNLQIEIDDNGIGIENSQALKTKNQRKHPSRGLKNVTERIQLLNDLYGQNIQFEIKNKSESSGTSVIITCKKSARNEF
uniref:tetratricopeptide repeat-containing sensor histidine kinase n=1 Tax=Flavobacterium sp. TaxID=239 RepID=UPI00404A2B05